MNRKYTDEELIAAFPEAKSISDLLRRLGIDNSGGSAAIVKKHLVRLGLDPEQIKNQSGKGLSKRGTPRYSLEELLVENSPCRGFTSLKKRLTREGLLGDRCEICGLLPEWNSESLVLILDHINGIKSDCRLTNLRLVCPNCNSQLPTFTGRNKGEGRRQS